LVNVPQTVTDTDKRMLEKDTARLIIMAALECERSRPVRCRAQGRGDQGRAQRGPDAEDERGHGAMGADLPGGWGRPSGCMSRRWLTASGSWATPIPAPWPPAVTSLAPTGRLAEAIRLYEQTLADSERVLGREHPNTVVSRNNLASAYETAGDLALALRLHEETLADSERILGREHPNTLVSRSNLASAYEADGDLALALRLREETLVDSERVLGREHPNTLVSRNNLAAAYEAAGDLDRALRLYEQTLADRERVFGPDHPDTLTSRNNLAMILVGMGRDEEAIRLYEQIVVRNEKDIGSENPKARRARETARELLEAIVGPGDPSVIGGGDGDG
jgi:tetratricopeptide (TPR) repeat protein